MSDYQKYHPENTISQPDIQELFMNNYVGLCVYAGRIVKDKSVAEELVQDTFYKLWEKRDTLQIQESLVAYLFRSLQNNCLNYLKHAKVVSKFNQSVIQKNLEAEYFLNISQETGLSVYLAQELEGRIHEAIEQLPEQCREIFIMSRFDGLKHHDIARKKKITVNTVQKQISIALKKIKVALEEYF